MLRQDAAQALDGEAGRGKRLLAQRLPGGAGKVILSVFPADGDLLAGETALLGAEAHHVALD